MNVNSSRIIIDTGTKLHIIYHTDIAYFLVDGVYTYLINKEGNKYLLHSKYNITSLLKILDKGVFFKIRRDIIINIDYIEEMFRYSKSRVKITMKIPNKEVFISSTERSGAFKEWLTY